MNLVIVNHMHPAIPHVSGMRAWYFARELAKLGHRVVEICEWREGAQVSPPPEHLAEQLQTHDWAEPLLLAIKPPPCRLLNLIRSAQTPAPLRKAIVCWSYLRRGGVFTDFSDGAQPFLPVLAREFQPQVTWGVFGNTDAWLIARRLARLSGCPWVADMKDSWEVFIPRFLRWTLAQRFQDMAACTANAQFNAAVLQRWFPPRPAVVYSGVDWCFVQGSPQLRSVKSFRLTVTGSIYDLDKLQMFVSGLCRWLTTDQIRSSQDTVNVEVIYAGSSTESVRPIFRSLEGLAHTKIYGYLSLAELASLCRTASVNTYIRSEKTFHHKLLELLACGRPVIAFPGETEEAKRLAKACDGRLESPADQDELIAALTKVAKLSQPDVGYSYGHQDFTWEAQAKQLETALIQTSEPVQA